MDIVYLKTFIARGDVLLGFFYTLLLAEQCLLLNIYDELLFKLVKACTAINVTCFSAIRVAKYFRVCC